MSNILLLYFALPVAITILSIIFETLINCPIKIAGITFSILLIFTFAVADETFLIFTILYTILSFVVAWITRQWTYNQLNSEEANTCGCDSNANNSDQNSTNCGCGCGNRRRLF